MFMKRKNVVTDHFEAMSPNGDIYSIKEITEFINAECLSDPAPVWIPGLKKLMTSDFRHVNRIDDNNFEIISPRNIKLVRCE